MEGFECPEIRFCGSGFDGGEELSKPVRYRFDGGGVDCCDMANAITKNENFLVVNDRWGKDAFVPF